MTNFQKIVDACKAGIHLSVNAHRNYRESVEKHLEQIQDFAVCEQDPEIIRQMIERNTVVDLQFYPLTPIGFHRIFHYDCEQAIITACKILRIEHG